MGSISNHYTRLERLASDKHSSLQRLFVSYEENDGYCEYDPRFVSGPLSQNPFIRNKVQ